MLISISLRALAFILFIILASFAFLQINDPDPYIWASFYLVCAMVPLLLTFTIYSRVLFWLAVVLCIAVMGLYSMGAFEYLRHSADEALMQSMNPQKPYIEEAREFLGGLIALGLLAICRVSLPYIRAAA